MAEDSRFDHWVSKLRIKPTMCVRTFQDALGILVALGDSKKYDGVSFMQTFKPKIITYNGQKFLQATLKQSSDLMLGLNFPFNIVESYISCGDMPFQKLTMTQSGDFYQFPTPFQVPSMKKTRIIVRFDEEISSQYYSLIPFSIVSVVLEPHIIDEMKRLPEQRVQWKDHNFGLNLIQLPSRSMACEISQEGSLVVVPSKTTATEIAHEFVSN